jgi:hypothetical protein
VVGHVYLGVCDRGGVLSDRSCILRSGSLIALGPLQFCLSQPAQKTFLGGVLLTEFPQCGLECSHPVFPDREITQVSQQSERLVVFIRLPLLNVRCNPIPSPFLSLPQLIQRARAVSLVFLPSVAQLPPLALPPVTGSGTLYALTRLHLGRAGLSCCAKPGSKIRNQILLVAANSLISEFTLRKEITSLIEHREAEGLPIFSLLSNRVMDKP